MPTQRDIFSNSKAGFVAVIGRTNAGKSTFLNALINENIALVSHKINATRKRMNIIVMHENAQLIFIDTPGIHKENKKLNQFMREEYLKALESCDVAIFIAPINDSLSAYEEFLEILKTTKPARKSDKSESYKSESKPARKHIILLSKIDLANNEEILAKLALYEKYHESYAAIIPISSTKRVNLDVILNEIARLIPHSPYFYDTDIITSQNLKEIYKEKIRESIFEFANQEIPYQSDVIVNKVVEGKNLEKIFAQIIVQKNSQKIILIGKNGRTIKNIGIRARKNIESFINKKVFLKLEIIVHKGWISDKKFLKEMGY